MSSVWDYPNASLIRRDGATPVCMDFEDFLRLARDGVRPPPLIRQPIIAQRPIAQQPSQNFTSQPFVPVPPRPPFPFPRRPNAIAAPPAANQASSHTQPQPRPRPPHLRPPVPRGPPRLPSNHVGDGARGQKRPLPNEGGRSEDGPGGASSGAGVRGMVAMGGGQAAAAAAAGGGGGRGGGGAVVAPVRRMSAILHEERRWGGALEWDDEVARLNREVFGNATFRPKQREVINAVLSGRDVFVRMPTGGGKSLCFQLPARYSDGLTVVVMPLIALIQDQVSSLAQKGVGVTALLSTQAFNDQLKILDKLEDLSLLFLTPEKLCRSTTVQGALARLHQQGKLRRFVIDEAHCVVEWGSDFRPDYTELKKLRNDLFPSVPLMALTASATPDMQHEIMHQLMMHPSVGTVASTPTSGSENMTVEFHASCIRDNLKYVVLPKKVAWKDSVAAIIRKYFDRQCGIIYCLSRPKCEELSDHLKTKGIEAAYYHAQMTPEKRTDKQKEWMNGTCHVLVATSAFGLGIGKPDVRFVIHACIPKSLDTYYQESGRAGRDGQLATCVLLYDWKDKHRAQLLMQSPTSSSSAIVADEAGTTRAGRSIALLLSMCRYCEEHHTCRRQHIASHYGEADPASCEVPQSLSHDSDDADLASLTACDNCIARHIASKSKTKKPKAKAKAKARTKEPPRRNWVVKEDRNGCSSSDDLDDDDLHEPRRAKAARAPKAKVTPRQRQVQAPSSDHTDSRDDFEDDDESEEDERAARKRRRKAQPAPPADPAPIVISSSSEDDKDKQPPNTTTKPNGEGGDVPMVAAAAAAAGAAGQQQQQGGQLEESSDSEDSHADVALVRLHKTSVDIPCQQQAKQVVGALREWPRNGPAPAMQTLTDMLMGRSKVDKRLQQLPAFAAMKRPEGEKGKKGKKGQGKHLWTEEAIKTFLRILVMHQVLEERVTPSSHGPHSSLHLGPNAEKEFPLASFRLYRF
ncbi:unnamed protein product [Vitrella brassicaformis CCMP3155]|uniref:ATP-dependent DNA helicase n=2 Tax=Vitrella brassicaformis TaxID=1169539 RepID=A0A0G4EW89_VITBC|nr:unnamed protein product [Vitrella brassicaformis CCMP3155]|eukprot:CEM02723.1 unnamed protein product [Vitrella brassicaformis CCMP3155]